MIGAKIASRLQERAKTPGFGLSSRFGGRSLRLPIKSAPGNCSGPQEMAVDYGHDQAKGKRNR